MVVKVTKKIKYVCNGIISQNKCHEEYIVHGKFHGFSKSAQLSRYAAVIRKLL